MTNGVTMEWALAKLTSAERKVLMVAELRKRAAARETITYGELSKMVGLIPNGLSGLLDQIGADERREGRPDLACLVVNAGTGLPGYIASEKQEVDALAEQQRVFNTHRHWTPSDAE